MSIVKPSIYLRIPGKSSRSLYCHEFGLLDLFIHSDRVLVLDYIALSGGVIWPRLTGQNRSKKRNYLHNNGRRPTYCWAELMEEMSDDYSLSYFLRISTCGGYGTSEITLRQDENIIFQIDIQPFVRKYNKDGELFDHPENIFIPGTEQHRIVTMIRTEVVITVCNRLQELISKHHSN